MRLVSRFGGLRRVGNVVVVVGAVLVELLTWGGRSTTRSGASLPYLLLPVLVVVVYALLLVRGRWPRLVFVVEWSYALAGLWVPGYQPVVGLFVALHALATRCTAGVAYAALLLSAVPIGVASWNGAATRLNMESPFGASFAAQFFLYAVIVCVVWGLARRAFHADRRSAAALAEQAEKTAALVEAERLRLARELHDIVSSSVTAMLLQAAGARAALGGREERVERSLYLVEQSGEQAMRELHRLLGLLRQPGSSERGDDSSQPGLRDLDALLAVAAATDVDVQVRTVGLAEDVDPSIDLAAYRVVQEGLTNVAKHGGRNARAELTLEWHADSLGITLDSVGEPLLEDRDRARASFGFGLAGLSERVAIIGGRLSHQARPRGFRLCVVLPVERRDRQAVPSPTEAPGRA